MTAKIISAKYWERFLEVQFAVSRLQVDLARHARQQQLQPEKEIFVEDLERAMRQVESILMLLLETK